MKLVADKLNEQVAKIGEKIVYQDLKELMRLMWQLIFMVLTGWVFWLA